MGIYALVLPCAASGDMCWCERLWIWCLYAYTASTSTMMHPIMPPATGPTGALLIMFKEATSSSAEERTDRRFSFKEVTKDFRWLKERQYNKPVSNSSGSDPHSCWDAGTFSPSLLFSRQCEVPLKKPSTAGRRPILFPKKITRQRKSFREKYKSK